MQGLLVNIPNELQQSGCRTSCYADIEEILTYTTTGGFPEAYQLEPVP